MAMEFKNLVYAVDGRTAIITMNTPENMNALTPGMVDDLVAALQTAAADANVKAVILTGVGKVFCAGGDLNTFKGLDLEAGLGIMDDSGAIARSFQDCQKPIIAAVNGYAIGAGLSLALLSDFVVAADNAVFSAAYVSMGLVPDMSALYFLPRAVGLQKAKELALTGKNIDAAEAMRIGLVSEVVPADELLARVGKIAGKLCAQPAVAMKLIKVLLNKSFDLSFEGMAQMEVLAQSICFVTDDCQEGIDAFLNKRKPVFK